MTTTEQVQTKRPSKSSGPSMVPVVFLVLILLLWGSGYLVGAALFKARTEKRSDETAVLDIRDYWIVMSARGKFTIGAGVDSVQHKERPLGPDGQAHFVGPAANFAPVEAGGASYYRFGDRWLPVGWEMNVPYWIPAAVLAAAVLFTWRRRAADDEKQAAEGQN